MNDFRPDLEAVWEHYGKRILSGSGEWQKCECPLLSHEDNNPSASVNVDAGKWTCFSCDKRGDAFDVIGENEGVGFAESRRFAEANFAAGSRAVRPERVRGGGLLGRPRDHGSGGNWRPPWTSL